MCNCEKKYQDIVEYSAIIAFYYKTENNDMCCKMLHQVTFNNGNENEMMFSKSLWAIKNAD